MTNRFTINSSHQSFTDKQKNLFDLLENAEKSAQTQLAQNQQEMEVDVFVPNVREQKSRERNECKSHCQNERNNKNPRMNQYKSRESIFKRPEAPLAHCLPHGRIPGFRKNPQQWTKYTLADVKNEHMSDKSNTQAAFSFLKSLEKNIGESKDRVVCLPEKIVFKKSSILRRKQSGDEGKINVEEEKHSFKSSKVVMPEYVVGQSMKKKPKKKVVASNSDLNSQVQLKLDHLNELDNDV